MAKVVEVTAGLAMSQNLQGFEVERMERNELLPSWLLGGYVCRRVSSDYLLRREILGKTEGKVGVELEMLGV